MNSIHANAGASAYQLKSEMARVCLPAPHLHARRNLAWTNSICLFFLLIGLVGFRPKPPPPLIVKPLEEATPVIIEVTPPPQTTVEPKPEDEPKDQPPSDAPRVVVVTPDSPAIIFSVPTLGNLIVPNALAQAPPVAPLRRAVPVSRQPILVSNTGDLGERPSPPYPKLAAEMGQQGAVVLLLTGDEAGVITSVEIKETSGSSILDRASVDFVKRHWTVPPGPRGRLFQATINYILSKY
ncbi:MAG: TonB family protein [Verrucomicrobiota bacterium]|jgi:protein TonB